MANEPNAISEPRLVLPFILPFCTLLNFVFFGCNIAYYLFFLFLNYELLSSPVSTAAAIVISVSASIVSVSVAATATIVSSIAESIVSVSVAASVAVSVIATAVSISIAVSVAVSSAETVSSIISISAERIAVSPIAEHIGFGFGFQLEQIILAVDQASANPHFHAQTSVGCVSLCVIVIYIGTQGVQRRTSFFEVFRTCYFRSAYTSGDGDLNAFRSCPYGVGYCRLDNFAVKHTSFYLPRNLLRYQDRIQFGSLNFRNIDLNILLGDFLQFFFQLIHLGTQRSDDHARTSRIDCYCNQFQRSFNVNF
jgi:hypothetical protein